MKEIRQIQNIRKIVGLFKGKFIFVSDAKELNQLNNNTIEQVLDISLKLQSVNKWNSGLILREQYYFDGNKTERLFDDENVYFSLIINENNLLVRKIDFEKNEVFYGKWVANTGITYYFPKTTKEMANLIIDENKFICEYKNIVKQYSFLLNKPVWQKEFPEEVTGDILPYKDKLLISLNNGDFICLKQTTGKEVWKCGEVYGYTQSRIIDGDRMYLLSISDFIVVDLKKGKIIKQIDLEQINKKLKIAPLAYFMQNRCIYFTSSRGGTLPQTVGSFNIDTFEYDWLYRFENIKNKGFPSGALQFHAGKLYVLDMDGVLHIFEDE